MLAAWTGERRVGRRGEGEGERDEDGEMERERERERGVLFNEHHAASYTIQLDPLLPEHFQLPE